MKLLVPVLFGPAGAVPGLEDSWPYGPLPPLLSFLTPAVTGRFPGTSVCCSERENTWLLLSIGLVQEQLFSEI